MQYADSVTKSFLTYGNPSTGAPKPGSMSDWQDPTYMGFQIRLVRSSNSEVDLDDFPHGLFCGFYTAPPETEGEEEPANTSWKHSNKYSTYNYLISRGEYKRAEYIRLFETGFSSLLNDCPWYFIKVSGLADAWKIDAKNNWRAKDKKITVETLESIDMKMSYLIDCYRKAVFDANWMRWAVPDHMRWFKMDIIISEVRPMKIGPTAEESTNNPGPETSNEPTTRLGKLAKKVGTSIQQKANSVLADVAASAGLDIGPKTPRDYGLTSPTEPWSAATFIKFSFEQCELDLTEAPPFLETVGIIGDTVASNKFVIKPGVIHESNTYGLLGAILDDTLVWQEYGKDAAKYVTSEIDYDTAKNIAAIPSSYDVNPRRAVDQEAFNSANGKPNSGSLLSQIGGKVLAGAASYAENAIKNAVNGFLLGNVYEASPLGLFNAAQSVLNNPAAAIEGLLARQSSPGIASRMAKKVELTGAEIFLVKTLIGQATLNVSDTNISDPGSVSLVAPNITTETLGKGDLAGPAIEPTQPGKTILSAVPSNDVILGSTTFEAPNINTRDSTNVNLTGPEKPQAIRQKTNLTAFASAGEITSKVNFIVPNKNDATAQNVGLDGPEITSSDLGDANLSSVPTDASTLGKADLAAAPVPPTTLGKANL
jgi:hypothetical protein